MIHSRSPGSIIHYSRAVAVHLPIEILVVFLILFIVDVGLLLAQPTKLFEEFSVNGYTIGAQNFSKAAAKGDGGFVVIWESEGQDGSATGVFRKLFDWFGQPITSEDLQVSSYSGNIQALASASSNQNGDFVVAWTSCCEMESEWDVFARRFTSSGNPLGDEFQLNSYTTGTQRAPRISVNSDGSFTAVWESHDPGGAYYDLFARRFGSDGTPQGSEFRVNTTTEKSQNYASVGGAPDGSFVVVWQSYLPTGHYLEVVGRMFDSTGGPISEEFRVNTYTSSHQSRPAVAVNSNGEFLVVWTSINQDGDDQGVFGQGFNADGSHIGSEFQVNVYTRFNQFQPAVTSTVSGQFFISWASEDQDDSRLGVMGRLYAGPGMPASDEMILNTHRGHDQQRVSVSSSLDGRLVAVWDSRDQDGSSDGVYGQILAIPSLTPSPSPTATATPTITATSTSTPSPVPTSTVTPTCVSNTSVASDLSLVDVSPGRVTLQWDASLDPDFARYEVYRALASTRLPANSSAAHFLGVLIVLLALSASISKRRRRFAQKISLLLALAVGLYEARALSDTGSSACTPSEAYQLLAAIDERSVTSFIDATVVQERAFSYQVVVVNACGMCAPSRTRYVWIAGPPTPTPVPTFSPVPTPTTRLTPRPTSTWTPRPTSTRQPTNPPHPTNTPDPCGCCANSGACAGHGGVNCAAGPDSDGSVICNDGWRDSSVVYSCRPC